MEAENVESRKLKVLVIIGSSGVGKSKLAVELALLLNGEIISADSMQVYQGIPISSNQITLEEMKGVKHHLIAFLPPSITDFNATKYIELAIPLIEDIHARGKIPIVVGGTFYYVEALLFSNFLIAEQSSDEDDDALKKSVQATIEHERSVGTSEYEILKKLDPVRAEKLHPNDSRKIQRSLEILLQSGKQPSQHSHANKRYDECVLWVDCHDELLEQILDARTQQMLERGLLTELESIYQLLQNESQQNVTTTKGLLQSIGVKEFQPYLEDKSVEKNKDVLSACIESFSRATKRYTKTQRGWIKHRFADSLHLYQLSFTELATWMEEVFQPALHIATLFFKAQQIDVSDFKSVKKLVQESKKSEWKKYTCSICNDRILNGEHEWNVHLKSKAHKAAVRRQKKLKETNSAIENKEHEKQIN